MSEIFRPVRPRRLSDHAMEQIQDLVLDGTLQPGVKLPPERELMELLSVSRTSLREAIRTLETMGVLRVTPGRGTYVCDRESVSLADDWYLWLLGHRSEVVQMLEVHEALEVKVSELAAERISQEGLQALTAHFEEMGSAVTAGDHGALVAADSAFHRTIREAGGNVIIARILNDLEDNVLDARRALMAMPSRVQRVIPEHGAILEAIATRNPEAAGHLTLVHVRNTKEELLSGDLDFMRASSGRGARE